MACMSLSDEVFSLTMIIVCNTYPLKSNRLYSTQLEECERHT